MIKPYYEKWIKKSSVEKEFKKRAKKNEDILDKYLCFNLGPDFISIYPLVL